MYSYKANSNLVLTAQRTGKRSRDPSGEVSRMDTKNLGFTMGDRVRKETPPAEGFGSSEGRSKKQIQRFSTPGLRRLTKPTDPGRCNQGLIYLILRT